MVSARWLDLEARALWHLELLGCYDPADAKLWEPTLQDGGGRDFAGEDDEGTYLGEYREPVTCWGCGGEGTVVDCCDDLCHGQDWCMHGDNRTCRECHGEGVL